MERSRYCELSVHCGEWCFNVILATCSSPSRWKIDCKVLFLSPQCSNGKAGNIFNLVFRFLVLIRVRSLLVEPILVCHTYCVNWCHIDLFVTWLRHLQNLLDANDLLGSNVYSKDYECKSSKSS